MGLYVSDVAMISKVCLGQFSRYMVFCVFFLSCYSSSFAAISAPTMVKFESILSNNMSGSTPSQLAIADLDNNSFLDIAVLNTSSVTILLSDNAGSGAFQTIRTNSLPAGFTPMSIAVADIDGDNNFDLIISLQDKSNIVPNSQVVVYAINGDGSLAEMATLPRVSNPSGVSAADFSGDGIADIAVANTSARDNSMSSVTLFETIRTQGGRGPGDGVTTLNFTSSHIMMNGNSGVLSSADMNDDNIADLISDSDVYINNGTGGFSRQSELDGEGQFAIGHLDRDRLPDIAQLQNKGGSSTEIIVQTTKANGSLATIQKLQDSNADYSAIDIADVNQDGLGDIIVVDRKMNTAKIFLQNCDGNFSTPPIKLPNNGATSDVTSVLLNNDNAVDIVALFHNNGGNGAETSIWLQTPPQVNLGTIQLCQDQFAIDENVGTVEIEVNRINGSNGAISINYTAEGFGAFTPATPGLDFDDMSGGSLVFQDGEIAPKRITFSIIDDTFFEADETFLVTLNSDIGGLGVNEAYVNIINNDINQPPLIDIGVNQTVVTGSTVILDGSTSSDPDGGVISSYQWLQLTPSGNLVSFSPAPADVAQVTFVAPLVTVSTIFTFELTVGDSDGAFSKATVTVTVEPTSIGFPIADAGVNQAVVAGDQVILDGGASSAVAGSSIVAYSWSQSASDLTQVNLSVDMTSPEKAAFTAPTLNTTTILNFLLTVEDDLGRFARASVMVTVGGQPLSLPLASAGSDRNVVEGSTVLLDGSNSSMGSNISYQWTSSSHPNLLIQASTSLNSANFVAPTVLTNVNPITIDLTVTDNNNNPPVAVSDTVLITVVSQNNNLPPLANAGIDQTVFEGARVSLDGASSSDSDGTIVAYLWKQIGTASPVTLNNATEGIAEFTAYAVSEDTTLSFQLMVTDDQGATSVSTVNVTITAVNQLPNALAGDDRRVQNMTSVILDGSDSVDADGSIVSYFWEQVAGTVVVLNGENSVIANFMSPDVSNTETLSFSLTITDNEGGIATDMVTISVVNELTAVNENPASEKTGLGGLDSVLLIISALLGLRRLRRRYLLGKYQ